jgi:ABC-2 type transport system permease protein
MPLLLRLVAKDLRRKMRSPLALIVALAFPLVFAGMIGLAFGGGGAVPKVRLLVDNEDGALLSNAVASIFTSRQASPYFDATTVDAATGRAMMDEGKASALLTIPKGFSSDLLDGRPVKLSLLRNPAEGILPEIAEQTAGTAADLLDGARRVLDKPLADLRPYLREGSGAPGDADVVAIALAVKRSIESAGSLLFPPAITLDSDLFPGGSSAGEAPKAKAKAKAKAKGGNTTSAIFLLVLPGVAVYGLFLVGDQAMRDIMTERTLGTLRRQLAGPITPGMLILGKALYTAVLSLLGLLVVAAVGAAALSQPVDAAAFVLVSLALILAVTGLSALIYGLARTERQGSTLGNMVFLAMGFLGGGFIRVESLPAGLRGIAPFTPLYWGTQGYRAILEHGASVGGVLLNVEALAAMGVAFLALGIGALQRAARRGAVA